MSERSKLTLTAKTPAEDGAPASAADKTRAWNVSPARADKLKELARDMRRNPSEAEVALWERLKDKKCGGFSFTRQVVMGSTIVDFACRTRWLVVETGASSEAEVALAELSDRKLTDVGVRVLRFSDDEILADLDAVVSRITAELQKPFEKPGGPARRSQSERPARSGPRGDRPGGGGPRRDRPYGDRPYGDRSRGERSGGDRSGGGRREGGQRDGGRRDGGGYGGDRPRGDRPGGGDRGGAGRGPRNFSR